jgi:hypothetical protein
MSDFFGPATRDAYLLRSERLGFGRGVRLLADWSLVVCALAV